MSDITELRKLADAATPGPWSNDTHLGLKSEGIIEGPGGGAVAMAFPFANVNTVARNGGRLFNFADADFIVAARNALPALLDELDRLREEREHLSDRHDRAVAEFNRMLYEKNRLAADNARLRAALQAIAEEKQLGVGMSEYVHGRSAAAIAREALTPREDG